MTKRCESSLERFFGFVPADESIEILLTDAGQEPVCGVDEAGRGPLAGPVVAAALVFRDCEALRQARDSKTLTRRQREEHYRRITDSLAFSIGLCTVEEIDCLNILQASLTAMERAINGLSVPPKSILVDGIHAPKTPGNIFAIPHGDARIAAISAASIIAKVHRDRVLIAYDKAYPEYGFARHMGYPTLEHRAALKKFGPCPIHRRTFKGVREFFHASI
ncbi:MAG: ribonuclease HII [bacterium]|nr:ribonuclease HII [bacterium]